MKKIEYWLAEDGTRFDSEESCKKYEDISYALIGYDTTFHRINLAEEIRLLGIIEINTEEALEYFKGMLEAEYIPTDGLDKPGIYYNDDIDSKDCYWMDIDETESIATYFANLTRWMKHLKEFYSED